MHVQEINSILNKESFTRNELLTLLQANDLQSDMLYKRAQLVREQHVGKKVFFRGLIELSNQCKKNCLYCGIRTSNSHVKRYSITDEEVLSAAIFAWEHGYGSIALQAGEKTSSHFTQRITQLLRKINKATRGELGITLSLGEQSIATYKQWFDEGALRYLLRIEASNRELYAKLHPQNSAHDFDKRIEALHALRNVGYQVGSGVMVGLPFQTLEHLVDDLLWMQEMDLDMVGMGPYVEHADTPLFQHKEMLLPAMQRLELTLKMIAILRIAMKDINMVASTALQAIEPHGRERALKAGANIIMPNVTPGAYREDYNLYENKPKMSDSNADYTKTLEESVVMAGFSVGYGEQGNAPHFKRRSN